MQFRSLRIFTVAFVAVAGLFAFNPGSRAAQDQSPLPLEIGKPIERELAGGQAHSYQLTLAAGQYLRLVVEQRGIDVVVTLFGPDGKKLVEVDSPNGTQGPEPVSLIAEVDGSHRVEVHALEKHAKAGRYEIKIAERREASANDKSRVVAERAIMEGERLNALGTAQSLRKSVEKYEEALLLWREISAQQEVASALTNIGDAYGSLGENQKALDYYSQALSIRRAASDQQGEATVLNSIGWIYNSLSEKQKALDFYHQALLLRQAVGDRSGEAVTLNNLSAVHNDLGDRRKALTYAEQALLIWQTAGDRRAEATNLNNIGAIYFSLGEEEKALAYYHQSLPLRQTMGDRRGEARTLNNIGLIYGDWGERQKALDYLSQALPLSQVSGDRRTEALTLSNIGVVYSDLGERQKALDYFNLAIPLLRAVGDRQVEALTLANISAVHSVSGNQQQALDFANQALLLLRSIGNRSGEAKTLNNIGGIYSALKDDQKSLEFATQSLLLWRSVGGRRGEAQSLADIGVAHQNLGEPTRAIEYFNQALSLMRASGDREGEARTLYHIARIKRNNGQFTEARSLTENALGIIESLRTKIAGQELRASYFATVRQRYEFYTDLLMQLHKQHPSERHDAAALQASERACARGLLELLTEARADIRQGVDPSLLGRERSLQQLLNAKAERQTRLLSGKHTEEQAKAAAQEIEALTTQYREIQAQIRAASPRYAALTQPQPLSLKEIQQQVLDSDTLLLEYALGDERSYLWAATPTSITSHELPKRAEIEAAATRFYDLVKTDAQSEVAAKAAAALSRMLLSPVAAQLGTKRLVIVADGALQYVPFAALADPQATGTSYQPLIVAHEIVNLPSASTLAVLRRETAGRTHAAKTVAVLADPVFASDDVRVKRAKAEAQANAAQQVAGEGGMPGLEQPVKKALRDTGGGILARLINSRREATGILALTPESARKRATDFAANLATATSEELGQYRYVHFATHGLLDSAHPELSGVVLSLVDEQGQPQDGFLRLHDIYNLKLPVELVVLSACQTALGKDIKGEGLVGLTRGFMYAGAPRVVASLWKVDDKATSELMKLFYHGMLGKEKLRPAEALRAAQVAMWKQKRWQSPYYWAAFVMQGEWK